MVMGVDLLDYYRTPRKLTLRRIAVLTRNLPGTSATVRALHAPSRWSASEYLLASIVDTLQFANWLTVERCKKKGAPNPLPQLLTRPGDETPEPEATKVLTGRELADWLKAG